MPTISTAGSDDSGQQSSASTFVSRSTNLTSLYDMMTYHPQPAQSFYVDFPQGTWLAPAAQPQYMHDPRLNSSGYIQQAAPPSHHGFGSGGGYFNSQVAPFNPSKLSGQPLRPNTRPEPPLHTRQESSPSSIQRIPQVDQGVLSALLPGGECINPVWRHICPPGGSAYGHPTIVLHDVQQPTALVPPPSTAIPITETKVLELLPPATQIAKSLASGSANHASDETLGDKTSTPVVKACEPASISSAPFTLDKYAPTYIPQWLKELPPVTATFTLPPAPLYPPSDFAANILPQPQLRCPPYPLDNKTSLLFDPPIPGTIDVRMLDEKKVAEPGYYSRHFSTLLALALEGDASRLHSAIIYKAFLAPHGGKAQNQRLQTYRLTIPGIREDFPRVQVGDVVVLRALSETMKLATCETIEARVTGFIKIKGWLFVSAPWLERFDADTERGVDTESGEDCGALYNVTFVASTEEVCMMQNAVRTFGAVLDEEAKLHEARRGNTSDHSHRGIAHRWLFPEPVDAIQTMGRGSGSPHLIDPNLNTEQMRAVHSAAHLSHRVPYIISGPPGTGKTRTLVESVMQILHGDPEAKVLVVAPSNPAADTLASRLAKTLTRQEMFRLCSPARTFAEVPDDVLAYCCVEKTQFAMPPIEELLRLKVVVCNCLDAGLLVQARVTNLDLMRAEQTLSRNLHPSSKHYSRPHWTHLLVDEAAQGTEPAVLIPMSVVLPLETEGSAPMPSPAVILVGDCHQLGPVITSARARSAELDTSLLERLIERKAYSTQNKVGKYYAGEPTGNHRWQSITNLLQNYRSIAPILMVPSALFYEDRLMASATDVRLLPWKGLPNPLIPIAFIGCETLEECVEDGASWYNDGEVAMVVQTVQSLLDGSLDDLQHRQVAVITPWREQTWRLRAALRSRGFRDVNVGDVESYQGAEYRVTILSCVRSRARFVDADKAANMGFINERKRFNVAITRAKEILIVIGNANLLKIDPYWQGFLQVCLRNGLYTGPELVDMAVTGAYLSMIESKMKSIRLDSFADPGLLLSAEVAREALRE